MRNLWKRTKSRRNLWCIPSTNTLTASDASFLCLAEVTTAKARTRYHSRAHIRFNKTSNAGLQESMHYCKCRGKSCIWALSIPLPQRTVWVHQRVSLQMWFFFSLFLNCVCACLWMPFASILHFVQIISEHTGRWGAGGTRCGYSHRRESRSGGRVLRKELQARAAGGVKWGEIKVRVTRVKGSVCRL